MRPIQKAQRQPIVGEVKPEMIGAQRGPPVVVCEVGLVSVGS